MKKTLSTFFSIALFAVIALFSFSAQATEITAIDSTNTTIEFDNTSALVYDATQKQPGVNVLFGDKNFDYTVTYANNTNAGRASVTVNGVGAYSGSITKEFDITTCDISTSSQVKATMSYTTATYNGEEIRPTVAVYFNNSVLKENKDYKLEYINNINAGNAEVKITGLGNFSGSVSKSFTIKPLSIAQSKKTKVTFEKSSLVYYDTTVTPIMYVAFDKGGDIGYQYLIEDIDYTVSYVNVNTIGKAKAKITGIGNYTGTYEKYFIISPQTVGNVKISNVTNSSLVINWSKLNKISGYEIVQYNPSSKKYTHLAYLSSKTTSYKINNLSSAKSYKFKIRAYKTVNDKKYYGEYSVEVGTLIKPTQVTVTAVTADNKKLTVEWNKTNCSGYEIFYSTDKKMKKNVKTVTASGKKNSAVIKGINDKKKYYVKVRAYSKENGKTYYGKKSAIVSSYFSNVYATYYSYYENNAPRTTNLRIASKAISGTIINPGETFSFNEVVGPRTVKKGYKSAHVFQGEQVTNGVGGGVCQVASTMFNCVLKANVTVKERHQHSQRVAYVPLGRDAAIYGSAVDFKWTNNTKHAIKIEMTVKDGKISCTFYTCKKAKPSKVDLNVTSSGGAYTLKRSVDGKVNYTTTSRY